MGPKEVIEEIAAEASFYLTSNANFKNSIAFRIIATTMTKILFFLHVLFLSCAFVHGFFTTDGTNVYDPCHPHCGLTQQKCACPTAYVCFQAFVLPD